MKKLEFMFVASILMIAASCSSTYHSGSSNPDDVYYSTRDGNQNQAKPQQQPASQQPASSDYSTDNNNYQKNNSSNDNNQSSSTQNADYSNTTQTRDANGNTYVTNNYYNDDYYDYAYSARLKRYYAPVYGYGYYDPYYTNLYWYDYNPSSWGISIYLGYNWWAPSYYYNDPFCYGGFHHYYDPWYSPYGGYHAGYWNGYNQGYYHGYADGAYGYNNPYYYNSYDATSYYYGPRGSVSSNGRRTASTGSEVGNRQPRTLGEKYAEAVHDGRITRTPKASAVEQNGNVNPRSSSDPKDNIGRPRNPNAENNANGLPARGDKNPSTIKSENARPESPGNSGVRNNPVNPGSEGAPPRGIITEKNETGRPDRSNHPDPKTGVAYPNNPDPGKNDEVIPSRNQPNNVRNDEVKPNQNTVQPNREPVKSGTNEAIGRPDNSRPRQNENYNITPRNEAPKNNPNYNSPRPQQNESRPVEVPKNNERPQNQQAPAPNPEPRRPRQMSNSESPQFNSPSPQMNRSPEIRSSPAPSNGNSSSGSGRSSSTPGNGGGRGRR